MKDNKSPLKNYMNIGLDKISKMSEKELRKAVKTLVDVANKRIKRLSESENGRNSPAFTYNKTHQKGVKFSTKGKNINQLRNEFKNVKNFLNSKTSTIRGWKKTQVEFAKRAGFNNVETAKDFWKIIAKAKEKNADLYRIIENNKKIGGSEQIQSMAAKIMQNNPQKSKDDVADLLLNKLQNIYDKENNNDVPTKNDDEFFGGGNADDNDEEFPY